MKRLLLSMIVTGLIGMAGLAPAAGASNAFSTNSNAVPYAVADGLAYWATYRYCAIVMNSTYGFTGNSWAAFCTDIAHEIGNLLGFKEQNAATWYDPQDVMEADGKEKISLGYGRGAVPAQCAAIPAGLHY
jgi:hypothetical protein